jgi:hypothetical protein
VSAPPNGLPDHLPPGEELLWQGAPSPRAVARHVLHLHWVIGYFLILWVWRLVTALPVAHGPGAILLALLPLLLLGSAAVALLAALAWLMARTSVYSITTRRVVLRVGVALPISFNIPFGSIDAVDLKPYTDGAGDISLRLNRDGRVGYAPLWPHARPWKIAHPEPTLRGVRDAAGVAKMLAQTVVQATR